MDGKVTIKSNKEVDKLFKEGRRVNTSLVAARIIQTSEERDLTGRVAFVAGKKLGNAVFRNRCKRVMRVMVKDAGGPWPGCEIVFIARGRRTAVASREELLKACLTIVKGLG